MKRAIVWAFLFVVLVLLAAQAIDSNRAELTRSFAFQIAFPLVGAYQTTAELTVAAYFVICVLLGAGLTALLSLAAVIKAELTARRLQRELRICQDELDRLRGPAHDDDVYRHMPPPDAKE
jgi:hypothetical protein